MNRINVDRIKQYILDPRVQKAITMARAVFAPKGRARRLTILFVCVPTLLVGLYLTLFFSSMYVSESHMSLRSSDLVEVSMVGSLFGTSGLSLDGYVVQAHIESEDMMQKVLLQPEIIQHYKDRGKDIYSRLERNPTREELVEYWNWVVTATFDPDKNIISIETKAYTPEMAQKVNAAIVTASEDLVNAMNARAHSDTLKLAETEVKSAEKRLLEARAALQEFRDRKQMFDPGTTARGLEELVSFLESELASNKAQLLASREALHETSPTIINLETKIKALTEQLDAEKARLAGFDAQGQAISSVVGDYARLVTEETFASELFVQAMGAYETARIKAIHQSRYIVPFQPPTLPQESLYPRPLLFTVLCFFGLLTTLGICSLLVAAIMDHMGG